MLLDHLTDAASYTIMSSNSFFDQAPTAVLPPAPDQCFTSSHYLNQNSRAHAINGISPNGLASSNSSHFNSNAAPPSNSLAGRKRSRGDTLTQDDAEDERLDDGSVATPTTDGLGKSRGKPVYGPGMTILYPDDPGYDLCAESQSGTWVEERGGQEPFKLTHAKRPSTTSRKSQRTMNTGTSSPDDLAQLVLPPKMREVTSEPLIDEATRVLGISWTRMDSTEALQISQKAYSKWIQNHYHSLKDVTVWFENSAIPGYLGAALNVYNGQHEYYIFSDDLTEARLVTNEPSQLMPRLQLLPALHLAAPGGHIRAETDPITAAQNELNGIQTDTMVGATQYDQPNGACAAHAMELD